MLWAWTPGGLDCEHNKPRVCSRRCSFLFVGTTNLQFAVAAQPTNALCWCPDCEVFYNTTQNVLLRYSSRSAYLFYLFTIYLFIHAKMVYFFLFCWQTRLNDMFHPSSIPSPTKRYQKLKHELKDREKKRNKKWTSNITGKTKKKEIITCTESARFIPQKMIQT